MRFGLKEKIISSMILISFSVSLVLAIVFYTNSRTVIEQNFEKTIEKNLQVCAGVFDDVMKEAYYAAVNSSQDEKIRELLSAIKAANTNAATHNDTDANTTVANVSKSSTSNTKDLCSVLDSYRTGHVDSVYCYLPDAGCLVKATATETAVQTCEAKDLQWIQEVLSEEKNPFIPKFTVDTTELLKKEVFTYAKPVKNAAGELLGWVIVNIDERNVFFFCLQGYGIIAQGSSCILNPKDYIVSGTNLKHLGKPIAVAENDSISVTVEAPLTRCKVLFRTDYDVILGNIRQTGKRIFALMFLFNLLALIPILTLVRKMLLPVKNLEEVMKQAGQGDLTVQAEVYADDEIGLLSKGFNEMIRQVEELIDALIKEQDLKKEAEIEALKYQITPHFMYNTLNSIRYAAVMKGEEEIAELLQSFIQLLQMSASDRGAFVTVEKEIQLVSNYVKLQRFRYSNSFDVIFRIQESAKNCYVPSLMLQPLVENAILHGIDLKKGGDRILISVTKHGTALNIRVSDNGRGMTEEEVERLMSGVQKSKFSGIGIRNVRERLELYYKGEGNLTFESEKNQGTVAILCIPASENPEEYSL